MESNTRGMTMRTFLLQVMQGREKGKPIRILGRRTPLRMEIINTREK